MKISSYLLSAVFLVGCSSMPDTTTENPSAPAASASTAASGNPAEAIAAAEAARKKAASVGHEWRDTEEMLKKAQEALDKGDTAKALELANAAKLQGEAAYIQGTSQSNVGPRF